MEKPLITTLIPTYRRPDKLKKAIQSVLAQTEERFQIVVYDNASQDETKQLVLEMCKQDGRIQYHAQKKTVIAVENFQKALESVETPYFSFLADDDELLPHFFEIALQKFASYPAALFFLGSTLDVTEEGKILSEEGRFWPPEEFFTPPQGLYPVIRHYFNWTGALFKKEILSQGLQLDPLITAIDLDFVLQAAARFPFVFSRKRCALFIHHEGSYSAQCGVKIIEPGWKEMVNKLMQLQLYQEKDKIYREMEGMLKRTLRRLAVRSIQKGYVLNLGDILRIYKEHFTSSWETKSLAYLSFLLKKIPFLRYPLSLFLYFYRYLYRRLRWFYRLLST